MQNLLWSVRVGDLVVDSGKDLAELHNVYHDHLANSRGTGKSVVAYVCGRRVVGFDANEMPVLRDARILVKGRAPFDMSAPRGRREKDHDTCTHHVVEDEAVIDIVADLGVLESTRGGSPSYDPAKHLDRAFLLRDGRTWITGP